MKIQFMKVFYFLEEKKQFESTKADYNLFYLIAAKLVQKSRFFTKTEKKSL